MRKSILNTEVTFLHSVMDTDGKAVPLATCLFGTKWREHVQAIRAETDEAKQKAMKKALPCFTASGLFEGGVKSKDLKAHSGFICIDVDEQDNRHLADFDKLPALMRKEEELRRHVAYCGHSVRGKGFFLLIPIADPDKHKEYFRALEYLFRKCGISIDQSCNDITRKRYVSYDPDAYFTSEAEPFNYTRADEDKALEHIVSKYANKSTEEIRRDVEALLSEVFIEGVDVTPTRPIWVKCLCAIGKTFGEDGREYAHQVSCYYPGYSERETDALYTDLLKRGCYAYTIGTLFYLVRMALDDPRRLFREFAAKPSYPTTADDPNGDI